MVVLDALPRVAIVFCTYERYETDYIGSLLVYV